MNNDFKLFRIMAILRSHFHNFWIIVFPIYESIFSPVKAKALVF